MTPNACQKRIVMHCTQLLDFDITQYSVDSIKFEPWSTRLLNDHCTALHQSFCWEADTLLFPSLGTEHGCRDLIQTMSSLPQFAKQATWLALLNAKAPIGNTSVNTPIGTIQALVNPISNFGDIQNIGVVPQYRRQGIAEALLARCMDSFKKIGRLSGVTLEVSASNEAAINLYRKFGFRPYKTIYVPIRGNAAFQGFGI
jgi:GNAT superfamily N-acetyltransferase